MAPSHSVFDEIDEPPGNFGDVFCAESEVAMYVVARVDLRQNHLRNPGVARRSVELLSITPDLAVYGKARAAGWPCAALVGRRELFSDVATRNSN
jgi:hypothetical protein